MGLMEKVSGWLGNRPRVSAPVLVLGLDRAGKTSLLRALRPPDPAGTAPAPSSPAASLTPQIEHFQSGGVSFSAWDVSGAARARALWERHYRRTQAIIFVVDAADHLRLVVAREELELVLAHPDMCGRRVPLLVLANKSDAPGALPPERLASALCLERIHDRPWHVCATSARSSATLHDGISWLARQMCYGSAGENSNKEKNDDRPLENIGTPILRKKRSIDEMYGSETEQKPDDPKYKDLIAEVVYNHVGLNKEETKKNTVNKITTQVSGVKIKSEFHVELENGKTIECLSEIWEKLQLKTKMVTYQCKELDNHAKYIGIAKESVKEYLKSLPEEHSAANMLVTNTTTVETRVTHQKILYINIDVINVHFNGMESIIKCSVLFDVPADLVSLSLDCFEDPIERYKGAEVWANPSESKYSDLIGKAIYDYITILQSNAKYYDIIVTFVVHKISWGKNKIDFIARWVKYGHEYKCRSVIWEKSSGNHIESIRCKRHKPSKTTSSI